MDAWAVVEYNQPLQKIKLPKHDPTGTEVVIAVTHSGVCHSDVHLWEGYYDLGGGKRLSFAQRGTRLPIAPGHEIVGVVVRCGAAVKDDVEIGSQQIVYPWLGCGQCRQCAEEKDNMCLAQKSLGVVRNGGFAAEIVVPHPRYLVSPGILDPSVACTYACSGMTAFHAVQDIGRQHPDDYIVIIGTGGLGLSAVHILRAMGHNAILAVDLSEANRKAAIKAGALAALSSADENVVQNIRQAVAPAPVVGVIDFVNISATAALGHAIVDKGGIMAQVGLMGGELQLSLVGLVGKALTIRGTNTGALSHFRDIIALAQSGKLVPPPVTTLPWDSADQAMSSLRDGKVTGRLVLVHDASP